MLIYTPSRFNKPDNLIDVPSAWKGLEWIIEDIIKTLNVKQDKALEFGVEFGFSTVALANYFKQMIGVDHFMGDEHTEDKNVENLYEMVKDIMPENVKLYKESYQDYIYKHRSNSPYDLIHVDIVHTYEDTFACGDWSIKNAPVVLFHDTESFKDVKKAVNDLANKHNCDFYNYPNYNGLGILCRK